MPWASMETTIWNRAALSVGSEVWLAGDRRLCATLRMHGLIMNGGVLHALRGLAPKEAEESRDAYRAFGLEAIAALLSNAEAGQLDEASADRQYEAVVGDDSVLEEAFLRDRAKHPEHYGAVE